MTDTQRDRLLLLTADLLMATLCPSPPSEPRTRRDTLARELGDLRAEIAARTALEPLQDVPGLRAYWTSSRCVQADGGGFPLPEPLQPMQAEPWQAVLDRVQRALQDGWTALHAAYRKPAGKGDVT